MISNKGAFAGYTTGGQGLMTWGLKSHGGDSSAVAADLVSGVGSVYHISNAFAVLKLSGKVITWGTENSRALNLTHALSANVTKLVATDRAFAASKSDGSVITWGNTLFSTTTPLSIAGDLMPMNSINQVLYEFPHSAPTLQPSRRPSVVPSVMPSVAPSNAPV